MHHNNWTNNMEKADLSRSHSMQPQRRAAVSKPPVMKLLSKQLLRKTKSTPVEEKRSRKNSTIRSLLTDVWNAGSPNNNPNHQKVSRQKSFNVLRVRKRSNEDRSSDSLDEVSPEDRTVNEKVNRSISVGNVTFKLQEDISKAAAHKSLPIERKWSSMPLLHTNTIDTPIASPLVVGTCSERQPDCSDDTRERKHSNKVLLQQKHSNVLNPDRTRRRSSHGNNEDIRAAFLDNHRLEELVSSQLESDSKKMSYDPDLIGLRCRRISKNLECAVKRCLKSERNAYKIIAQVFMGELKGHGICFATQCTYQFSEDYFATSTFQTDDMFICAIVTLERV